MEIGNRQVFGTPKGIMKTLKWLRWICAWSGMRLCQLIGLIICVPMVPFLSLFFVGMTLIENSHQVLEGMERP